MTTFTLDRSLYSYEITRDLLKNIEDYLLKKVPAITNIDFAKSKAEYLIEIIDDSGTEELECIDQYYSQLFSDTAREISLNLEVYIKKILIITIRFSKDKSFSKVNIRYKGENAREIALAIYEGIKRIINFNKTNNIFFHPPYFLDPLLTLACMASLFFAIISFDKSLYFRGIIFLSVFAILIIYMTVGKRIHPYTMFDSTRSRNYKKWSNWFWSGILTFIVFDVILMLMLKKLLGM